MNAMLAMFKHQAVDLLQMTCSAIVWANHLRGDADVRVLAFAFGGVVVPVLGRWRHIRRLHLMELGVLSGVFSACVECFWGGWRQVVVGMFWMDGETVLRWNMGYSILFFSFCIVICVVWVRQARQGLQ